MTDRTTNKLAEAIINIKRVLSKYPDKSSISAGDYHIIARIKNDATITEFPEPTIAISTLANNLEMSLPALNKAANRLVQRGYIKKVQSQIDLRVHYICLTNEGIKKYNDAQKEVYQLPNEIVQSLGNKEANHLVRLLDEISSLINKRSIEK